MAATTETTDRCAVACSCVASTAVEELQAPVAELRGYLKALARSDGTADPRLVAAAHAAEAHGGNLWLIDGDDGLSAVWLTIPDVPGSGTRHEVESPWSR